MSLQGLECAIEAMAPRWQGAKQFGFSDIKDRAV